MLGLYGKSIRGEKQWDNDIVLKFILVFRGRDSAQVVSCKQQLEFIFVLYYAW